MNEFFRKIIPILVLISIISGTCIMCAVPPVSRDALTHHLAVPKLYLQAGKIYEIPDVISSYYPQLLDLIYCVPLFLGNDIMPKYLHFFFALLTALLIFHFLKKRLESLYAFLGCLFFLSLPVIIKLSTIVYVDLGLIFFSNASLIFLLKWQEKQFKFKWLAVSAIFCGLALSTKYNGLITFFLLTLLIPFIFLRGPKSASSQKKAIGYGLCFLIISLAVFSPWMVKNYLWTKNPVYPLYSHLFKAEDKTDLRDATPAMNHFLVRKLIHKETWFETLAIPLRIFFQGQDDNPRYFDGRLNPLLFFLPILAFVPLGRSQQRPNGIFEKKILGAFSVLFILIVFFQQDMRIRWIGPAIPPLVILSAYGLKNILSLFEYVEKKGSKQRIIFLKSTKFLLLLSIFFAGSLNAVYAYQLFKKIDPLPYIAGKISRSDYIEKFRPEYTALEYANQNLGDDTQILAFFLGNRMYYSAHDIKFNYPILKMLTRTSTHSENILKGFQKHNITALIVNHTQFNEWVSKGFSDKEKRLIQNFFRSHTKRLFFKNGHGVYQLISN